jgi:uncharacterized pyridoxal phosphate-dependent enzyme
MGIYDELGVRRVINASATLTRLGGSLLPPPAIAAMTEAAGSFVELPELQARVGERIAALTRNEAAYVSAGAAAGITLTVAACMAGTDPVKMAAFPYLDGIDRTEVVVHRSQRNGYDYAARQTGARLVEVGSTAGELAAAITERTACVLWFAGALAEGSIPLAEAIAIAHEKGVPVIVDAAAQIPPIANLWRFTTELGADGAIFSGGKGLRGPQVSGLVLGQRWLIEGCAANGNPNHSLGRPMKVGKEELCGLLAALEWSLAQDEPATIERYEEIVRYWIDGLQGIPGVTAERVFPSEAGQPHARAVVRFAPPFPLNRDEVAAALWGGSPRIAVSTGGHGVPDDGIALNPQTIEQGEEVAVLEGLKALAMATAGAEPTLAGRTL